MRWAYGVIAVPGRFGDLLPRTLESLKKGGFDQPRLFVDGVQQPEMGLRDQYWITRRVPRIKTAGNWHLGLTELYYRDPWADRYAMFQDDLVCVRNLRQYLEEVKYEEHSYWNLYTFPSNVKHFKGFYPSGQLGKGAVALVFDRATVIALLTSKDWLERIQQTWKSIDGGIIFCLKKQGWHELVHNPSLVQHTGQESTMANKRHPVANTFPGEECDALSLPRR